MHHHHYLIRLFFHKSFCPCAVAHLIICNVLIFRLTVKVFELRGKDQFWNSNRCLLNPIVLLLSAHAQVHLLTSFNWRLYKLFWHYFLSGVGSHLGRDMWSPLMAVTNRGSWGNLGMGYLLGLVCAVFLVCVVGHF